ncbi:LURP-one-related/scramblase family protein [Dethiothermospora halolimnae]|uniref:LURP-one-related/scramblase family protein n=1 Tax=Dethiothermospora halolimnae TaxID=3114390 RepID=UPI003CCC1484
MSIYYMEQQTFSTKDKYQIYDTNRQQILEATGNRSTGTFDRVFGNFFSIGYTLNVNNIEGELVFTLNKKRGFIWSHYDMLVNKDLHASIQEEKSLFKSNLIINSSLGEYKVNGDVFAKNFTINKAQNTVAKIKKKTFSFGDSYEISVYEEDNYKLFIATAIAIDNCKHN